MPDPAGSGELVLAEELPGAAPAPARAPGRSGWRLGDSDEDHHVQDHAGLSDHALDGHAEEEEEEEEADPRDDGPELGQLLDASPQVASDAALDTAGSGEGPLLLDASPDSGPLPPLPPQPPPGSGPVPGRTTPTSPLPRLGAPAPAGGQPAKISRRFYDQEEQSSSVRPPTRRMAAAPCKVCGGSVEANRCVRCGQASGADAFPVPDKSRSTPRAGSLSVAVRDRLARESEQRAAMAAAEDQLRRRGRGGRVLAGTILLLLLGAPVSWVVASDRVWLVGVFLLLDAALGAFCGRSLAKREGALSGQIAAGGAMAFGVAVKLLYGALSSHVSLLLSLGAAGAACVLAALLGGLLARPMSAPKPAPDDAPAV